MMSVLPVTEWYQIHRDENGNITNKTFNHFEQGHVKGKYPSPVKEEFTNQKGWSKLEWELIHATMTIHIGHYGVQRISLS